MEESIYGEGDPKKGKKVDSCTDGKCGPTTKTSKKRRTPSFTKSRYSSLTSRKVTVPAKVEEKPKDTNSSNGGSGHMNVRDLGGSPGYPSNVRQQGYDYESDPNKKARSSQEVTLTKKRKFFGTR